MRAAAFQAGGDLLASDDLGRRRRVKAESLARSLREPGPSTSGQWDGSYEKDGQLGRIQHAIIDDPALAVGSAKELIESTAKVVLKERGLPIDERADLPVLVRDAQQALGLHPSSAIPGPDGSDAVRRILGSMSGIAIGLAELRNRGYGTGHGPALARQSPLTSPG